MVVLSWFILALGLGVMLRALFWDRPGFGSRPKLRCRKCWYDLTDSGELSITCSECGHVSKTQRSMTRVRRHKKMVAFGLVMLLASPVVGLVPRGMRGELFTSLPNWVLIELQPLFPEQPWSIKNHPSIELMNRLIDTTNPMSHEQTVDIIEDVTDGSIFAKAGSKRWGRTTGKWFNGQYFRLRVKRGGWLYLDETGWQYLDGTPADEAFIDAIDRLMSILPEWDPMTRDRWPKGYRVSIESGFARPHWPVKGDLNEHAVLRLNGYDEIEADFLGYFSIEPLGNPGDVIEGEIELSMYRMNSWDRTESDEPVRVEIFPIRWHVVGSVDRAVEQVRDSFILETVREELVVLAKDGEFFESIMQSSIWESSAFERMGMGLRITLFDGDKPITEHHLRWICRDGDIKTASQGGDYFVPFDEVDDRVNQAFLAGTLRVKIVGDPDQGMRILDADHIWIGEIDILYSNAIKQVELIDAPELTGDKKAP